MIFKKVVINTPITCILFEEQMMLILRWAKIRASKFICLANVHMIMEAYKNPSFNTILHHADLVTPDGKPLVWMLRKLGIYNQNQAAGMDIFLNLCNLAESTGIPVYFLGSTEDLLSKIKQKLDKEYPILKVAGMKSLPLMSIEEISQNQDKELIEEINGSGAGLIFVCLGCPKQEIWMSQYQGLIKGVMIGVGAVFSMYAGITPRAPYWIQRSGLEWLHRLIQEPQRLWWRYSSTIPPFVYLAIKQLTLPCKEKPGKEKWQLLERNIAINVDTLDFSPEKLGQILIRQSVLTREELEQALSQQKLKPNLKIGEILVRCNFISLSQLKFYLKNQTIQLGQLLVEKKEIEQCNLDNILHLQNITNNKLGQIIIKQKKISEDKIEEILIEQYTRRKGWFLTKNIF